MELYLSCRFVQLYFMFIYLQCFYFCLYILYYVIDEENVKDSKGMKSMGMVRATVINVVEHPS